MTAKELTEKLQSMPQDAEVLIGHWEHGEYGSHGYREYDDVNTVRIRDNKVIID